MTSGDQEAAVGRLLDYYQHAAVGSRPDHYPDPRRPRGRRALVLAPRRADDEDALAWLRAERASLLACLDHAAMQQMPERVVALTAGLSPPLRRDGPWAEAVTWHQLAARVAAELADQPGQAGALLNLAHAHWLTANFPAAAQTAARALAMFGDLGDQPGEASASVLLADTQRLTGDYPAAARLLVRALSVFEAQGDPLGETKVLLSLGVVRRMTGDYRSAAAAAQRALTLSRQLGRQRDHAQALVSRGTCSGIPKTTQPPSRPPSRPWASTVTSATGTARPARCGQ